MNRRRFIIYSVLLFILIYSGNLSAVTNDGVSIFRNNEGLVLVNNEMKIYLGGKDGEFRITGIFSNTSPDKNLVSENDPTIGLWKLHIRNKDGVESLLSTNAAPEIAGPSEVEDGGKIILRWHNVRNKNIDVTVELVVDNSRFVKARITVDNNSEYSLKEVDFPQIGGLGPFAEDAKTDKLIWPRTSGRLIESPYENGVPSGYFEDFPYPSASQAMQFTGIYGDGLGIYLAAYDSECNLKRLQFSKRSSARAINFKLMNFPENIGKSGNDYTMSYDAVISIFKGDWWDAGEIYRNWALLQPWVRKTTMLKDTTVSPEFKDIVMWMGMWGSPSLLKTQDWERIIEYFDVKMCGHWYSWSEVEFDTLYPEFLPAHEGFKEYVATLQKKGMIVMPYTNGRIWDTASKSFTTEDAICGGVINEKGNGAFEEYNNRQFLVMCPYSQFWQNKVISFAEKIASEFEVKALYLDQISAAGPICCFNEKHGHKPGGGNFWPVGYSKLIEKMKSSLKGKISFVTSESFTESYINRIDGFLLWLAFSQNDIPLAQMVYGGRTVFWGHAFAREDLVGNAFYVKLGRMLTRGIQPGWVWYWIMSPNAEKQREFLRQVVKLYERALRKEAFLDGTMRRPPALLGIKGTIKARLARQKGDDVGLPVTCDPVLAGAWEGSDGRCRILLVNVSGEPQNFQINLQSYLGKSIANVDVDSSCDNAIKKFERMNGNVTMTLEGRSAAALVIHTERK